MKKTIVYIVVNTADVDYTCAFTSLDMASKYICAMFEDESDYSHTQEEILAEMRERDAQGKVYQYVGLLRNEEQILCFATILNGTSF